MDDNSDLNRGETELPMSTGAIQRTLLATTNAPFLYQVFAVILFAWFVTRTLFKPRDWEAFPAWAAMEIALTGVIITKGNLSRRI